jgi:predicted TIM-barrel fold metal-dependent hydrolase
LRDQLRRIGDLITDNKDAENQTISDLIGFLTLALKPTIAEVTDKLFELSGDDTGAVALMMDITRGSTEDETLFVRQLDDTSSAALAYPGRLLPFVAVNPRRASHFARMDHALTQKGFVGVKLYPSLGYSVNSPEMAKVFTYCAANEVPVLMHCNQGGFCFAEAEVDFCNPDHWTEILETHPTLRLCFAHFGGDENLIQPTIPPQSWTAKIIALMKAHEGVYTDISFHTEPMAGGEAEKNYFGHLSELLADPSTRDRILFGSDFFLVRQRVREDNLWRYFETRFTTAQLKRITETNPVAYLGLPGSKGNGARPNILRYLNWLVERHADVLRMPSEWALTAIEAVIAPGTTFTPSALGPSWSANNQAHIAAWQYLRAEQMYPSQQEKSFNDCGTIRLRELMYWNKEHESPEIFANKRELVAADLDDALRRAGVAYEKNKTSSSARKVLRAALANGDTPIHAFAASIDSLYRFPTELNLNS